MSREMDVRDFGINRAGSAREKALRSEAFNISSRTRSVGIARFDSFTGNPALINVTEEMGEKGNYVQRALNYVQRSRKTLGISDAQSAEFMADPNYQTTSSGAVAVHLRQNYKGIKIFQAAQTIRFDPNGSIQGATGSTFTVNEDLDASPQLTVEDAVSIASRHIAEPQEDEKKAFDQFRQPRNPKSVDVSDFKPKVISSFTNVPDRPTVLDKGPFEHDIQANLAWLPIGEELRLAWEILLTMPQATNQFLVLVDAKSGDILYCHDLVKHLVIKAKVFHPDGSQPRKLIDMPLPWVDYSLPASIIKPPNFPRDWVDNDRTEGNNVVAVLAESAYTMNGQTVKASKDNGNLVFDDPNEMGDYQKVVNIFYYCNFMHDFLYAFGFNEGAGCYQKDNFGLGGLPMDAVRAISYPVTVDGTAYMEITPDGVKANMVMGPLSETQRHTAMDAGVVFHEYTHGLTSRLVGGPLDWHSLDEPQSDGMSEALSDYIACTILGIEVIGAWVLNDPNGLRKYPYDSNFPDNFGDLGKGRYDECHNIGEIWCATLMELNKTIGKDLALQLVIDSLPLMNANPSFIDGRDAVFLALEHKKQKGQIGFSEYETAKDGAWKVFAKFGMGVGAQSNGPSLEGIVPSFERPGSNVEVIPVHIEEAPNLAIPDNQPDGVTSSIDVHEATKIAQISVSLDIEHTYIEDLKVALISPAGKTVMLHDREGGSTHDIIKKYTSKDTPLLAGLIGEQAQGQWILTVADVNQIDSGTLRRWSLDINSTQGATGETSPGLDIPDEDPNGISSNIAIDKSGSIQDIKVTVDITHTYIGDLEVKLLSPSGSSITLHKHGEGSGKDNLQTAFDVKVIPELASLKGQEMKGNWILKVADLDKQDVGKLNKWKIELT